jgi:hypothetical protein
MEISMYGRTDFISPYRIKKKLANEGKHTKQVASEGIEISIRFTSEGIEISIRAIKA